MSFGLRGNNQIAMGLSAISTHSGQLSNIRAALEWSFGPHGDDEIATRLAAASAQVFLELSTHRLPKLGGAGDRPLGDQTRTRARQ